VKRQAAGQDPGQWRTEDGDYRARAQVFEDMRRKKITKAGGKFEVLQ